MNQALLDDKILYPIADFCSLKNKIVTSSYDSKLRVYSNNSLEKAIDTSCPFTKISIFDDKIIGISYNMGSLTIFDSKLNVISEMNGFDKPCMLFSFGKYVLIGSNNKTVTILVENPDFGISSSCYFTIYNEIQKQQSPTFICAFGDLLAISFENTVSIFNECLEEIYTKDYTVCISSLNFYSPHVLLIGFLNGKIQVENIKNSEESFLFNSHFSSTDEKKVMFPVTHLQNSNEFVFSSGYEGKILKWDLEHKKMLTCILDCKKFIRKFIMIDTHIYILVEDDDLKNALYFQGVLDYTI